MSEAPGSDGVSTTLAQKGKGKAVARDPQITLESGSKRVLQGSPTRADVSVKRTRTSRRVEEVGGIEERPDPVYLDKYTVAEDSVVSETMVPAVAGKVCVRCFMSRVHANVA